MWQRFVFFSSLMLLPLQALHAEELSAGKTDPPLTPEEVAILDAMPSVEIQFEDIVLPNGENALDFLREHDPEFLEQLEKEASKNK